MKCRVAHALSRSSVLHTTRARNATRTVTPPHALDLTLGFPSAFRHCSELSTAVLLIFRHHVFRFPHRLPFSTFLGFWVSCLESSTHSLHQASSSPLSVHPSSTTALAVSRHHRHLYSSPFIFRHRSLRSPQDTPHPSPTCFPTMSQHTPSPTFARKEIDTALVCLRRLQQTKQSGRSMVVYIIMRAVLNGA